MLYRKMRHLGYNFALIEECRVSFLMRKMVAQRYSNFAFNRHKGAKNISHTQEIQTLYFVFL